jgi:predicted ABC-type transport system involved in lysophospholipase L1 biosynthesis ATPase subunit
LWYASENQEASLADPHQVNSIISGAICDCRKDHPDGRLDPQEAKQIAKCILEALSDAGLEIVTLTKDEHR